MVPKRWLLESVRQGRGWSNRENPRLLSQPSDDSLRCSATCSPKLRPSSEPWNRCSQITINALANQRSASSSETERVGRSTSGLVVGEGEWGEDELGVCAREKRLKGRSKKWEGGDWLFLVDGFPSLQSNLSPSDDTPPRAGIQSSAGGFLSFAEGGPFGPCYGVLPGPVLRILVGAHDSHSSFGPSSPPPPPSASGKNHFFCCSMVVPSQRSEGGDLTDEPRCAVVQVHPISRFHAGEEIFLSTIAECVVSRSAPQNARLGTLLGCSKSFSIFSSTNRMRFQNLPDSDPCRRRQWGSNGVIGSSLEFQEGPQGAKTRGEGGRG